MGECGGEMKGDEVEWGGDITIIAAMARVRIMEDETRLAGEFSTSHSPSTLKKGREPCRIIRNTTDRIQLSSVTYISSHTTTITVLLRHDGPAHLSLFQLTSTLPAYKIVESELFFLYTLILFLSLRLNNDRSFYTCLL